MRDGAISLDGTWEFASDPEGKWKLPSSVIFDRTIQVPFSPETSASGIGETGFLPACWYRRKFEHPPLRDRQRLLLHFGAVDYRATVWIDGALAFAHEGGYTPFSIDVTDLLRTPGRGEVVVRAEDDPHDLAQPRGKQDWTVEPHAIWYPRTTGIWQTVWLEIVPTCRIGSLRWTPSLESWEIRVEVHIEGVLDDGTTLHVKLCVGDELLAEDRYRLVGPDLTRRIVLSDPGIDDYRNAFLWSPDSPRLIDAELEIRTRAGEVVDRVKSYTALRSIGVQGGHVVLNGRPLSLRMVLDQGYWPESGLTAPSDAALRRDVELAKAMGFNGVRKHQKIEEPRFLYWADRLGLLVWEEMPSAYRFTRSAIERLTQQWIDVIHRDVSHPCIMAWVPFNESWGVPNLPHVPAERHFVQALYHLTKTLDPTRPVIGNDGWESVATDIIGIHDYDDDPQRMAGRYPGEEVIPHLFRRERPGGRLLTLEGHPHAGQPIMLTEFGGISLGGKRPNSWGYAYASGPAELARSYADLLAAVHDIAFFAGFCYTQFTDTYQETNGLLYGNREPKIPIEKIREATLGRAAARLNGLEQRWRESVLESQQSDVIWADGPGATED
jgi:beta-galactosidase/beta-glucuronidase